MNRNEQVVWMGFGVAVWLAILALCALHLVGIVIGDPNDDVYWVGIGLLRLLGAYYVVCGSAAYAMYDHGRRARCLESVGTGLFVIGLGLVIAPLFLLVLEAVSDVARGR